MNTNLETLLQKYRFSEKDTYEIKQLFNLLSDQKKQNLLNNFSNLAFKLKKIDDDIEIEKNILIWEAVERIKNNILANRKKRMDYDVKKEINSLKGEILKI